MKDKKLLIVDGNSIMNRAFYGVRPLVTRSGVPTNAVYGYLNILKKHLDAIHPDYVAVAFDLKAPTFRHKMYDAYKAGRHKTPEELLSQVDIIKEATRLLGIATVSREGFEADDILGTLSHNFEGKSYLVTGDRDALQLVREDITLILASTGDDVVYTPDAIREKYSLDPEKMIDLKALMGDSSDNIPGVAGIGEKTAIKLLVVAKTLDGVYESLEKGELDAGASVKAKLSADKDNAYLSKALATINTEVAGLPGFDELVLKERDVTALRALFVELEFTKMMSRFGLDAEPTHTKSVAGDDGQISFDSVEESRGESESVSAGEFAGLFEGEVVTLDLIDGKFYYHKGGKFYSTEATGEAVDAIEASGARLSLFDSKGFWHKVISLGRVPRESLVAFDIQLASYIDNPDSRGDLGKIVMSYLSKSLFPGAEKAFDLRLPLLEELYGVLKERIESEGLTYLYYEVELPLSYVLAGMESRGFMVDREGIEHFGVELKTKLDASMKEIWALAGEEFNINSPKQLGAVLFEKLALPATKKNKTGYSTDAETLEKLRFHHPIVDYILEYRKLSKLYGTYIEGLIAVIGEDGRIHTSFNQALTQTGRLSSAEPNLQNIPVRTKEGSTLRRFFVAEEGSVLIDADYSQIELRVLAHMSGDENLISAFNSGADIHSATASLVFGVPLDKVTGELRGRAKAVNFGIVYGIGEFSLAGDLHVSMKEAKDYINGYFATYPKIKEYLTRTVQDATRDGYVTTMWGRKRYIPELTGTKKQLRAFGERVAKNSPIQGTAADLIKLAMVKTARRLEKEGLMSRLILQVHDELIIEAPESERERASVILKEEMERVAQMKVSLSVDVGVGKNWLEAKE